LPVLYDQLTQIYDKKATLHYSLDNSYKGTIKYLHFSFFVSQSQMRDYLCRLVFCHILGYDVEFGCIHAVKLAQQGVLIEKKIGWFEGCNPQSKFW